MADSKQDQEIDTMRLEHLVEPKCKEVNTHTHTHTHTMGGVKDILNKIRILGCVAALLM